MGTATRTLPPRPPRGIATVLQDIRAGIAACRVCPGMAPFRKHPVESFGTTRTGYVLIGEAAGPGPRAFADAAGEVMRGALADVGDAHYKELEDLFFLYHAARCVPTRKGKKRAPTLVECRTCRPYLDFEMRALHPRLVLAVGSLAATAVLGALVRFGDVHGRRWRRGDLQVLTLASPSPHNRVALRRLDITPEGYRRWLTGLFGALIDDLS